MGRACNLPSGGCGAIERMVRRKWYQDGLRFECTQCGRCCGGPPGYVWVTKKEIAGIAEFLGGTDGRLDAKYVRRVGLKSSLTELKNGDCIFLRRDGDKAYCGIYRVRPLQCRTFPFWSTNLQSRPAWNAAAESCPGMNSGKHHGFVAIEELRLKKSGG